MKNFVYVSPHFPDGFWKFCLALKNRGFNVLGIGDAPYEEIPEKLKDALTEYYVCSYMDNFENEVNAVRYFENKYGKIDFIESNNEYWLEKDAKLREIFNVTTGANCEEVRVYRHKSLQKEVFAKNSIISARYITDLSRDNLEKFISEVGFPIFAKPDNGVGAHGTFKINSYDDLDKFLSSKENNVSYIIEEFVDGKIVSFDGITNSKGEVIFYASNEFTLVISDIIKSNCDDMYYTVPNVDEKLVTIGKKVVESFHLKNRFFHIEFFRLSADHNYLGKKGDYVPLETNMRPAGGYTPDMINYANSISCYDIYADSCAYDENREVSIGGKFYCVSSNRRYSTAYEHSNEEVINKYKNKIMMVGEYAKILRDAMGDFYFIAKFSTFEELVEFDDFVRKQKK